MEHTERPEGLDPGPVPGRDRGLLGKVGIPGRLVVLALVVAIVYAGFRGVTYLLFAPELEVTELIMPAGAATPGDPVSFGAVVRNRGSVPGAAFVVAVLEGGIEVEGPSLEVPARDTAFVPVEIVANSGQDPMALVVFNGWRGIRPVHTFRSVHIDVGTRVIRMEPGALPDTIPRGRRVELSVPWTNPGVVSETVIPTAVFRPRGGGVPVPMEGLPVRIPAGESRPLELTLDTWLLDPGSHLVEIHVASRSGRRAGHGERPLAVEISTP